MLDDYPQFYDKMQSLATQDTDSPLPEARRIVPTARQVQALHEIHTLVLYGIRQ